MLRWSLLALLAFLPPAFPQEEEEPDAPVPEGEDPGTALYEKAVAYQRKGKWRSAQRTFRRFLRDYPDHALLPDAQLRSDENAYLGVEIIHESGPSARRIDVAVMGDGFTLDGSDQHMEEKWAKLCIDVLFNEKAFEEYKDYFNIWFVRLASFEEGVDPGLSPEDLKKAQERNLRRNRDINYKLDYKTALDCKAAGPQGQVMADPALVYKWLEVADRDKPGCGDDRFVIAFARFGILGMGGGGIANVGRPDKSVTVHEFGHAFSRLLDEYAVNPMMPEGIWARTLVAPNAYPSVEEPKPEEVPWAHMLTGRKKMKGVGIYEGGATFKKGVWKPARTCAMNVGGNQFCPVCREASILVIYEYVSPIDEATPDPMREVLASNGGSEELVIRPMQPQRHKLECTWYVAPLAVTTPGGDSAPGEPYPEEEPWPDTPEAAAPGPEDYPDYPDPGMGEEIPGLGRNNPYRGPRGMRPRDEYGEPPPGKPSKLGKAKKEKRNQIFVFPLGKLPAGGYEITAEVYDDTPWVVKDEKHLLKERVTWRVKVAPKE